MTAALPDDAFALALSQLPGCGQHRLSTLLDLARDDASVGSLWRELRAGHLLDRRPEVAVALGRGAPALLRRWQQAAQEIDAEAAWRSMGAAGIGVWRAGSPRMPPSLRDDPEPPPLLFWRGDPSALEAPAVAIVGTRRCTSYGADVARELGRDLAAAGVAVVSGLALGIDGAAHEGALAGAGEGGAGGGAAPVGVVGSGLDVVYPPRHRTLWRRVGECGLLLSEAPPGAEPEPWRFPRRNRLLAALAHVVVVVESHESGGSLSTVRAAVERGVAVMAVPGSVRSPSSAGTNRLLADGVAPVTGATDVLTALALEGVHLPPAPVSGATGPRSHPAPPAALDPVDEAVLAAVDWTPTATEQILRRTGLAVAETSTRLVGLEVLGLVRNHRGWWERVGGNSTESERGYTART